MNSAQLNNALIVIGAVFGAGFAALIYLGWKILKALERIEAEL